MNTTERIELLKELLPIFTADELLKAMVEINEEITVLKNYRAIISNKYIEKLNKE